VGVRITRTAQFEPEFVAALARPQGTLIEIMLDPQAITTRTTLSDITSSALKQR
jgi:acetolactate synthase-1/2/3 large subunit